MSEEKWFNLSLDEIIKYLETTTDFSCLNNINIKKYLIKTDKDSFNIIIKILNNKNVLLLLLDNNGIEFLVNDFICVNKINQIIKLDSPFTKEILKEEKIINVILKNTQLIYNNHYDYDYIEHLLDYIVSNPKECSFSEILICIDDEQVIRYLDSHKNMIIENNLLSTEFSIYSKNIIEYFLYNYLYIEEFINMPNNTLSIVLGPVKNVDLQLNRIREKLSKRVSYIVDIDDYRNIMNELSKKMDTTCIEKERYKYYELLLNNYDFKNNLITIYKDIYYDYNKFKTNHLLIKQNNLSNLCDKIQRIISSNDYDKDKFLNYLQQLSHYYIIEIIIDILFQDMYYNVKLNIDEVLNFNQEIKVLSNAEQSFYEKISNISELTTEELVNLYHKIKGRDITNEFYDIVRKSKNMAYQLIKDSIISEEKLQSKLNNNLSNSYGIPIYEFKGEPFYALIHASKCRKSIYNMPYFYENDSMCDANSYSIIDDNHLDTYQNPSESIVFGFDDYNIDNVIHLYHSDSYTDYALDSDSLATDNVNEISTPKQLLKKTIYRYNELLIQSKRIDNRSDINNNIKTLIPKYIVCYDEITDFDIAYANKYHLYIVLIHQKFYKQAEQIEEEDKKYLIYKSYNYLKYRQNRCR